LFLRCYTQEIPSHFKKDIIRAVATEESSIVDMTGLQRIPLNIGAPHTLSPQELKSIFAEVGNKEGRVVFYPLILLLRLLV